MADGHFHLLLRTGPTPLSKVMRRLMTGYAVIFNKRYTWPPSAAHVRLALLGRREGFRGWQAGKEWAPFPEPL